MYILFDLITSFTKSLFSKGGSISLSNTCSAGEFISRRERHDARYFKTYFYIFHSIISVTVNPACAIIS